MIKQARIWGIFGDPHGKTPSGGKLENAFLRPPGARSTIRENPAWPIPVPRHQSLRLGVTYSQYATRSMAAVGSARMALAIPRMPLSRPIVLSLPMSWWPIRLDEHLGEVRCWIRGFGRRLGRLARWMFEGQDTHTAERFPS